MASITTINSGDLITNSRSDINTNFANLNSDKIETSYIDTDISLAANSDSKIATQKAVKTYIDTSGGANASTTVRGIVEEATAAEILAGTATGATGARLFVNPVNTASTSAGSADAGKVIKLNSSGLIDSTMMGIFPAQDVDILNAAVTPTCFASCMNPDGSAFYIAHINSASATNCTVIRYIKDSITGDFMETHSTTLATGASGLYGIVCIGSYIYVQAVLAGSGGLKRYLATDLSGATTMTISGTNDLSIGGTIFTDGTSIYCYSATDKFRIYTISGTTATSGAQITYTSSGTQPKQACANATYVWISDQNNAGTTPIRKYAIAGGAVVSTTTRYLAHGARYNGVASSPSWSLFLASSTLLGISFIFNWASPTADTGLSMHLRAISLP